MYILVYWPFRSQQKYIYIYFAYSKSFNFR